MEFPSFRDLFNTFTAKFRELIPSSDPTIKGSWAGAFGKGSAAMAYTLVILAKQIVKQFNPLTATGKFLELWASYDNLTRLEESISTGIIRVFGLDSTVVPSGSEWAGDVNGLIYSNTVASSIVPQDAGLAITVISLNRFAANVTAVTNYPHGLSTGDWVKMSGADQVEYNGNYQISVFDDITFVYVVVGTPATPATGLPYSAIPIIASDTITEDSDTATVTTFTAHQFQDQQYVSVSDAIPSDYNGTHLITVTSPTTFTYAVTGPLADASTAGNLNSIHAEVAVQSVDTGPATAIAPEGLLTYQGAVSGIGTSSITIEGIQGGANDETDEGLRDRLLLSRSAQEGVFTNDQITLAAKLINGNTRIFIQNPDSASLIESSPVLPGQVRVYVVRDNDPLGVVPTGTVLQITKRSIIENGRLPGVAWEADVFVLAPVLKEINITMVNVKPNTASMRSAIQSQFNAYFTDSATFGVDVDDDVLRGVAIQTQDLNAGDPGESFIESFNWTNVSETVEKNELPILGTLTVNGVVV